MPILLFTLVIIANSMQLVLRKVYDEKHKTGVYTYTAVNAIFAFLFFFIECKGVIFTNNQILPYALLFAVLYAVSSLTTMLAIKTTAPSSLTSLIISYSLIIPTLYGLTVLNEPITVYLIIGIILLLISLAFINIEPKKEDKKITLKWVIFALLAFVTNGFCTSVSKQVVIDLGGDIISEFLAVSLLIVVIITTIIAVIIENKQVPKHLKNSLLYACGSGVGNGIANRFTLLLAVTIPASIMFPIISAGGIILTTCISLFFLKEKLSKWQILGFILGVGALVFLNI